MSKKLDAAIDALVDALAELPEHELEGWQRGNRLGLRILCELGRHRAGDGTGSPQVGLSRPCPLECSNRKTFPISSRGWRFSRQI